jgi:hypothetical protein
LNPISSKYSWKWQKNRHLVEALLLKNAPEFVYKANPPSLTGEIPVFTFHIALPDFFEEQCLYLVENGYETVSADIYHEYIGKRKENCREKILVTFDDGLKHVWTVAFPLLKKHGLKATCFLIPGCIPEGDGRVRPNLEDYWNGEATLEEILRLDGEDPSLATWQEISIMHDSGVIDFQSHTMYHSLVFTSNQIFDFMHPGYNTHFYGNIHVPIYTIEGDDILTRDPILGMPIYSSTPRMSAYQRYFDDEELRNRCVETVAKEGFDQFFLQKNWRKKLYEVVSNFRKNMRVKERYETPEMRDRAVIEELSLSKKVIEERLPGKIVRHLCFPWYEAADFAVNASKKAGFTTAYYGYLKGRATNRPGDDPLKTVRLEDLFLLRLPGSNRKSISALFKQIIQFRSAPGIIFSS